MFEIPGYCACKREEIDVVYLISVWMVIKLIVTAEVMVDLGIISLFVGLRNEAKLVQ